MSSFRQDQIKTLKERLKNLTEDYRAVNKQLDNELDEVNRNRLRRRSESLEQEINQLESKLNSLRSGNEANSLISSQSTTSRNDHEKPQRPIDLCHLYPI